jgi:hypothetical protein
VSDVASQNLSDDEQLLVVLREALAAARAVPPEVIAAGKAAFAWRTIDAELAALTYDSAETADMLAAGTRAEPASLRALTFTGADMTIELEVTSEALVGQITPARGGQSVAVRVGTTEVASAVADEVGYFSLRPVPTEPFRLLIRTADGTSVLTGWVSP